jgi:hypothetical protein
MYLLVLLFLVIIAVFLAKSGGAETWSKVPDAEEKKVVKYYMDTVPQSFGPPDEKALTKRFPQFSIDQLLGIRKLWAVQQIIGFTAGSAKGSLEDMVKKWKVPPLTVLKKFKLGSEEWARQRDIYTYPDDRNISIRAQNFEVKLNSMLAGLQFKTQEHLEKEQMKEFGYLISTPDFLFEKPLHGKYKWIDAKNFYGANVRFIKKKIIKQAQKYVVNHGPGIIVFHHGCNEIYNIPDVLFLSLQEFQKLLKSGSSRLKR